MDTQSNNNQTNLVIKRQVQIEAVSRAVYMITDLFEKDEPLRMSLRRISVECIESSNKKDSILRLISAIKLSKDLKLVSDMNSDILLNVLNDHLLEIDKSNVNTDSDIDISDIVNSDYVNDSKSEPVQIAESSNILESRPLAINEGIKKTPLSNTSITINNSTHNIKTVNNISMDIGSRRKKILEIVRSRGAVTINEFMDSIKGCSSKTIQRELTSLVLSGTLKKTGERRWSKYSLK